ncbi:MAG TPA: hypothetical protein VNX18_15800 [Bryobacteraceae bacterium]|nr:hypothetical protein [Bryobacteraceae bacterium]
MRRHTALAILALGIPLAALADITGTPTLSAGSSFNFDTGTTTSPGDITFTGTSITFQGSAKGGVLPGFTGATNYAIVTQMLLQTLANLASSSPIPASSLTAGTSNGSIIALQTNGGNGAKLLVTAISGNSISFQFTTYGASAGGGGTPTVKDVQNNSSTIPDGFSNSGVSPSSLIVIHGSNMADPNAPLVLWDVTNKALLTTSNGATINVTVNGTTVHPGIYYTSPAQIAAVLPANTPVGTGTISVTNNGQTSATIPIKVVASAFGINNYSGNTAVAQDSTSATGALYTPTNSAKPGGFATVWGTGLGKNPDPTSDTTYTTSVSTISTPTDIYVGGVKATDVRFVGASVYPGVQIVVFGIPQGVPNGCFVPVVIVSNGTVVSNTPTIAVMNNGGVCSDPLFGITGTTISTLSNQGTVRSGSVIVGQLVSSGQTSNIAVASFASTTGGSYSGGGATSVGSCLVTEIAGTGTPGTTTPLDAGASIGLSGPAGSYTLSTIPGIKGSYIGQLPDGAITSTGGAFTFTGPGGADVGAFKATVNLPNPLLNWTNQPAAATVTRSQGLLVTWTDGTPGSFVIITGSSSGNGVSGSYTCFAPQSALQFTVPVWATLSLPSGSGSTTVENGTNYATFSASGLDTGIGFGFTGVSVKTTYN